MCSYFRGSGLYDERERARERCSIREVVGLHRILSVRCRDTS